MQAKQDSDPSGARDLSPCIQPGFLLEFIPINIGGRNDSMVFERITIGNKESVIM
jgi:hypothetical protein